MGAHYRPATDDHPAGVYRVVGAGDYVALLRLTDSNGRRAHTGELRQVSAETLAADFEPAADPDAGLAPIRAVRNQLQGLYWSVRRFL